MTVKNLYRFSIIILFSLLLASTPALASAEQETWGGKELIDITPLLEEALSKLDLSPWAQFISHNEIFTQYTGSTSPIEFIQSIISGKQTLSISSLIDILTGSFVSAMQAHATSALLILGLALLCVVLERLSSGLFSGKISAYASGLLFLISLGILTSSFAGTVSMCVGTVNDMKDLLNSTFPIFTVLIASTGSAAASNILQPSAVIISGLTANLICNVIIPLLSTSAVLGICGYICNQSAFNSLSDSTKRAADWITGIMFTMFFGFISIQKLTSSALDTISVKTIKYTISSFSLYGGAFLSKSFDIVSGCAIMLKSVIGGAGMILLLTLCISPAVKLLAISVIYRICAFVITLTGESKISGCMGMFSKIYGAMFLCIMTAAVLFFILLSAVAMAGNSIIGV